MIRKIVAAGAGLLLLLAAGLALHESRARTLPKPDVLLIGIDTLRGDHLHCLGNDWIQTPNLDALARDGVLFTSCHATAPWTLPSFASILTGLLPSHHGAVGGEHEVLDGSLTTLAEILGGAGYRTCGISSVKWLTGTFGLAQGFGPGPRVDLPRDLTGGQLVTRLGEAAMDEDDGRPAFTFLHYFDVHAPYAPPPPFQHMYYRGDERGPGAPVLDFLLSDSNAAPNRCSGIYRWLAGVTDLKYPPREYAAGVTCVDDMVGQIVSHLKERGRYDDTLIIVVADHGEHLGEHDFWFTHAQPYEETLHVPLLIKLPRGRRAGTVVREPVSTLDVVPTVLDLLDLPPQPGDGRSLRGLVDGRWDPRASLIAAEQGADSDRFTKTLTEWPWKLMCFRTPAGERYTLFNLQRDPGELRDVSAQHLDVRTRLEARMWQIFDSQHPLGKGELTGPAPVDAATRQELTALGYVDSGAARARRIDIGGCGGTRAVPAP